MAAVATFVSGFVVAFVKQWKFTLILSCMVPAMVAIFGAGGAIVSKVEARLVVELSAAATVAEEAVSSIRTTEAFGMDDKLAAHYDSSLAKAQRIGYRKVIASSCMFAAVFFLVYMMFGLAFCYFPFSPTADADLGEGSKLIASGELNIGLLMNVLFAIVFASMSITLMLPLTETFSSAAGAAQKIVQTIHRIPPIDSLSSEGKVLETVTGQLEFQNVSFVYPSRPQGRFLIEVTNLKVLVLKNLSLTIPSGKFTAIVGASGSGKSTIIQLIERFYDPVEGAITLDGHDIKTLNLRSLRGFMSLVTQEPVLFNTSIYENVCHG